MPEQTRGNGNKRPENRRERSGAAVRRSRKPIAFTSRNFRAVVGAARRGAAITPGITTRENFSSTSGSGSADWCARREREERERRVARKGGREQARAPLPRDVVKYVAIYTGDWRHWRLGSESSALRWRYPLAHRISLCFGPRPLFRRPLTPTRAGVACRIKNAFAKSRCLPERCKIETVRPTSPTLLAFRTSLLLNFFYSFLVRPVPSMISDFLKIKPRLSLCSERYHSIIQ